jgi:glycosyltransferase involved in cell wall biosynthesis
MNAEPARALKRVCFVIPTLDVGGTERQLLYLIGGLIHDHEVTLVCTRHGGTLIGDARRLGAHTCEIDGRGGWDITLERKFRKVFRTHRPNVVHTFLFGFDLWANRAARDTGAPVVISSRRELATWKKRRHLQIQRKANQLVDAIVVNSHAVAKFAAEQEGEPIDRYREIYNGVDAEAWCSAADPHHVRVRFHIPFHTHVVGLVANFSPVKDHDLFLATAGELMKRRPDVHFLMVGRGPRLKAVLENVAERGWNDRFTQTDASVEMPDLYKVMSVVTLCSEVEGFPNVLMEGMAAGKPVVAPAVGGIPELIQDGETGRLVARRDPESFADAIASCLDHPEESAAMAQRAAAHVRAHFSVAGMVDAHRALYAELLAKAVRCGG